MDKTARKIEESSHENTTFSYMRGFHNCLVFTQIHGASGGAKNRVADIALRGGAQRGDGTVMMLEFNEGRLTAGNRWLSNGSHMTFNEADTRAVAELFAKAVGCKLVQS